MPITILEVEGRQLEQAIITCELTSLGNGFRRRTPTLLPITVHHNVAQPRIAMIDSECRDIQNRSLAVSPKHEVFEPNVLYEGKVWHAFKLELFWDEFLPKLEAHWADLGQTSNSSVSGENTTTTATITTDGNSSSSFDQETKILTVLILL